MTGPVLGPWLLEAGRSALDLVVPQECAGCGRPGRGWCDGCAAACLGPSMVVPGLLVCRAAAAHEGPAGRAVVAFKDRAARGLAAPLSGLLAGAVRDVLADIGTAAGEPVWLVPVPARRAARRARGADHMQVLAGRAARLLRAEGLPANPFPALAHARASRDQVGLGRQQRRANVAGTLRGHPVPSGAVVVVDDVVTTGATLAEAARALAGLAAGGTGAATVTWAGGGRAPTPPAAPPPAPPLD